MTHLFWLSDDAGAAIEPHLPQGKPGKPRVRSPVEHSITLQETRRRWTQAGFPQC
jgi:transposase